MADEFLPLDSERWKPVAGYEGLYEVSDLGRVRRLPRWQVLIDRWGNPFHRFVRGMILKATLTDRYLCHNLNKDGKGKTTRLNILVCKTFNGPRPAAGMCALHNSGDRFNNRADNLRWGTHRDNAADRDAHGTTARGERQHSAKLTAPMVRLIRARVASGERIAPIAREVGVSKVSIQRLVHRQTWAHVT